MTFEGRSGEAITQPSSTILSAVEREAIVHELEAICSDRLFSLSPKNREFLKYVVFETLAGCGDQLKERTIGAKLYKRPAAYDTGSDSVVRVRASDLRKRLGGYYEKHDSVAGWRIHLPLHSYVPLFQPESNGQKSTHDAIGDIRPTKIKPTLPLLRLMQPTVVVLFLCAAAFRWEIFSSTPYLDFWGRLLSDHPSIELVLDSRSSDSRDISLDDVNTVEPLERLAIAFHAPMRLESSPDGAPGQSSAVSIHLTHTLSDFAQQTIDQDAAYITLLPGNRPELWIRSRTSQGLRQAVDSICNAETFPYVLVRALHSNVQSTFKISPEQGGQLSAVVRGKP